MSQNMLVNRLSQIFRNAVIYRGFLPTKHKCLSLRLHTKIIPSPENMSESRRHSREYDNPYDDILTNQAKGLVDLKGKKILPEFLDLVNQFCNSTLIPQLNEGVTDGDCRDVSVYTGTTGLALVYSLLGERHHKQQYSQRAIQLADAALGRLKGRDISFILGDAGPLAVAAVLHHRQGDRDLAGQLVTRLTLLLKDVLEMDNDEVLYGRAGYLYALLFVNKHIGSNTVQPQVIKQVVAAILCSGQKLAREEKSKSPLSYTWHGKHYLGAAHGLAGILFILLQASEHVGQAELDTLVRPSVDFLLSLRSPIGNLPSSLSSRDDRLVQWCHGDPGFVSLLCLAHKVLNEPRYLTAALECGDVVWKRGLLTKGYSICHGVAGNAYAFLQLYQATGDVEHLYRVCQFAHWCLSFPHKQNRQPDRPLSLFEGLAGLLYFLTDLNQPQDARFPAFAL